LEWDLRSVYSRPCIYGKQRNDYRDDEYRPPVSRHELQRRLCRSVFYLPASAHNFINKSMFINLLEDSFIGMHTFGWKIAIPG
jgi:hypothetical protein